MALRHAQQQSKCASDKPKADRSCPHEVGVQLEERGAVHDPAECFQVLAETVDVRLDVYTRIPLLVSERVSVAESDQLLQQFSPSSKHSAWSSAIPSAHRDK